MRTACASSATSGSGRSIPWMAFQSGFSPSQRRVGGELHDHPTAGPGGDCSHEVLELGDPVDGVMAHGDVGRLDLIGHIGPRPEHRPHRHAHLPGAGLERLEHARNRVDADDQPHPRDQAQAGSAATDPDVEDCSSVRERLEGPPP